MLMISEGLTMDLGKVSAIEQWPVPQQLCDVQAFIGFSNFYQGFIEGFSRIVHPLTALTKNDIPFMSSTTYERSFNRLKKSFTSGPIHCHFDLERKIVLETDVPNLVVTRVFSQYDNNDILHPVAYFSRRHFPPKINYAIYDKELFAIIWAFKEWHPHPEGSLHTIKVISNH
jgi:hypothetical protein